MSPALKGRICRCEICRFTAKVARVQKKLSKRDAAIIESLLCKWEAEATNAVYYRKKMEGTWPS